MSRPWIGPFWNGEFSGKWRRPMFNPSTSRGTSTSEMPMSRVSPIRPSGSYMRNATPISVATGARVM